jgi:hypothetical protein
MHKQIFVCHVPLLNLFCQTCWKFPGNKTFAFDFNVEAPPSPPPPRCSCQLFTFLLHSPLFDAYQHFISYLCYIKWYAKISTLNICNHLATSYTHIPKTYEFDCYTNTCIHISTFLEQFCLWSKHFFFSNLRSRYKNSCIILISFQEFGATHSTHANTHMKGINFTLNLLQSVIHNPPPLSEGGTFT